MPPLLVQGLVFRQRIVVVRQDFDQHIKPLPLILVSPNLVEFIIGVLLKFPQLLHLRSEYYRVVLQQDPKLFTMRLCIQGHLPVHEDIVVTVE